MCLTHIGGLQWTISAHPPLHGHKCTCWKGHCGGFLPRIFPCVPLHTCPYGIILAGPRVTPPITDRTTFEVPGHFPPGSIGPLSGPHLPDSLKSSLICETMASWHQNDWWDSSHPHIYISRLACTVSYFQQDWMDDKLCHDVPSKIVLSCLAVVMIALSLLRNYHYKGQLNTTVSSSPWAL